MLRARPNPPAAPSPWAKAKACPCGATRSLRRRRAGSASLLVGVRCATCDRRGALRADLHAAIETWNYDISSAAHAANPAPVPQPASNGHLPIWPPTPGYYAMRLVKEGPRVAVRIWWGLAIIDGEEQDRGEDWRCEIDGKTDYVESERDVGYRCRVPLPIDRAWPFCAKEPIDRSEYLYLTTMASHAKAHDPSHPAAAPRERIDVSKMAPIF